MNESPAGRSRLDRQSYVAFIVVMLAAYVSLLGNASRHAD